MASRVVKRSVRRRSRGHGETRSQTPETRMQNCGLTMRGPMAGRRVKRQVRQRADELVRELVAAVVPEGERSAYLPFARELRATLHRPPVPDFSRSTKLVVMRWFRRGLSGRMMRLIGQRLIEQLFPTAWDSRVHN